MYKRLQNFIRMQYCFQTSICLIEHDNPLCYNLNMKFRLLLAVAGCKLSRSILRKLGKGATTFPGKVAIKICPDVLGYLAKNVKCVVVTGTNGKTTTSRMIEQTLIDSGVDYFANKSGANLIYGMITEFATHATITGKPKKEYALIESDEAAFKTAGKYLDAECVLVTNVFRDQLDRYGEITHTLNNIKVGIKDSKNAVICLNADCSLTASISGEIDNPIVFYGINTPIYKEQVKESSDAPYCLHCKSEYVYEYRTYGHLGKYECPNCGYKRPTPDIFVSDILEQTTDSSRIKLHINGTERTAIINLPGGYNIYNAVSAITVAHVMGFDDEMAVEALSTFECGFGRMEKFILNETPTRMILIKNPAGCNQVLNFMSNLNEESVFVILLSDNYADGTDISWIWDVDFESLRNISDYLSKIYVGGIRADDMAVRLKYAGIENEKISVLKDFESLIEAFTSQEKPVFIMPTYTAMMELRSIISKKFGYKNFWE